MIAESTKRRNHSFNLGFTLIEVVVVVLIIGILVAFGIPMYTKTIETSKADDAVSIVQMIGTTNRMFSLDRNNAFVSGQLTNGNIACPASAPYNDGRILIACGYLASQDWIQKAYDFYACDGVGGGGLCCGAVAGVPTVACADRKNYPAPGGTSNTAYQNWVYRVGSNGSVAGFGGAPPPPS